LVDNKGQIVFQDNDFPGNYKDLLSEKESTK